MITGYSTVSSVVVLWLMLGYVYLIRFCFSTVIAFPDCCTVLMGKVFLQFFVVVQ